jgi:hypothetical protein
MPSDAINEMPSDANIGPREQRKRRLLGIVALVVGCAAAFVLVVYAAPRASRLIVFFPLWIAGLGLMQAREKTCIALAARGTCNMDAGETPLADQDLLERLRHKSKLINRRALFTALCITIVTLIFP